MDLHSVCRICASSNAELVNLDDVPDIEQLISSLLGFIPTEYVRKICITCQRTLEDFQEFKLRSQETNKTFYEDLKVVKKIKIEIDQMPVYSFEEPELIVKDEILSDDESKELLTTANSKRLEMKEETCKSNFKCEECSRVFKGQTAFRSHKRIHQNEREARNIFRCSHCKAVLTSKETLQHHINENHLENKNVFTCLICAKIFYTTISYENHMKRHTEAIFKCTKCDKAFADRTFFDIHQQYHKEKVYFCLVYRCMLGFSSDLLMRKHMQEAHTSCVSVVCKKDVMKR